MLGTGESKGRAEGGQGFIPRLPDRGTGALDRAGREGSSCTRKKREMPPSARASPRPARLRLIWLASPDSPDRDRASEIRLVARK